MVDRGAGGSVLFVSSVAAFMPFAGTVAYGAAKAGMNHMASIIANELVPHRIRVNVIETGSTDTPGERAYFEADEQVRQMGEGLPWGRLGTIEELGRVATFLSSDAADYITGANLRVDGGFWLRSFGGGAY
jgi:glucose 1-dehydrogenase